MRCAIGLDVSLNSRKKVVLTTFLLIILAFSATSVSFGFQSSSAISSVGMISYWPRVDITVNVSKIIGVNNLALGFQFDWHRWKTFIDRPAQQQLAQDAGFKLIRVFDFRKVSPYGYPDLMPCKSWDEGTKTGTWDWTYVDSLTEKIFEVGAEPLFCLGWARDNIQNYIPLGMAVNPSTGLPFPESYAAYAKEWVKHFMIKGWPVRYYEIMNEPHFYFGWNPSDTTKLSYYVNLWNLTARAMRMENPNVLLSQDSITMRRVFDYWLEHGEDVDSLNCHKYDAGTIGQFTDAEIFSRAEKLLFESSESWYGINEARQKWFNTRGKWLPVIISESNINSACDGGTDPKIQQMTGAVWLALVLRKGALYGVNYNIYFEFSSSKSWQEAHGTGWGFGMTNEDNNQPWYPYYVHAMMGIHLAVGDKLVNIESSSNDIRCIAWIHEGRLNFLLICKVDEPRIVTIKGINGQLDICWIDNETPYEKPSMQTGLVGSMEPLKMIGYTVALLQLSAPS
jgi:hypothetical protein